MLTKPPIKTINSKFSVCSWILEKFPPQYENMRYIEPFVGNGSILLNKLRSIEETVSDLEPSIISIWKIIRDENKSFRNKVSKFKYTEKYFNFIKNKKDQKDLFKNAVLEFTLKKMTKNGNKEIFEILDKKKAYRFWKETSESLALLEDKIKNVYFVSRKPIELIESFDNQDTFCFCAPPPLLEEKNSLITMDEYVKLTDCLKSFRGKVLFYGNNCSFFKRVFSEWKVIKNKNSKKADAIWVNF